jgi:hypothetical protein
MQNEDLARQLVELGQRGNGDTMTREEFELRKREIDEQKFATLNKQPKVCVLSNVACAFLACFACPHFSTPPSLHTPLAADPLPPR